MRSSRENLLRPSLSGSAPVAAAPYSTQAGFISAFFGGPFAAALMIAVNARRTGRLGQDLVWVLLLMALSTALVCFLGYSQPGASLMQSVEWLGRNAGALIHRLLALLWFFYGMWLHRREQRSADLLGLPRPNGWVAGLVLIALGWGMDHALAWAMEVLIGR